ncbi:uncharacterized protein LOC130732206 [Lotus japonicus]|uniref:uncharacterized protein LOC130732206 n=1 Tax=Lotus japonicus TaxID=34305 RepID=UPI002584F77F|nr:uncharacterized protein LOC130732206 [Lotus japonicus]
MLKQLPNRNQRTKGSMIKQGFKIFTLIAVIIWLLFQLNHSLDKRKPNEDNTKVFEKLKASHESKKLGRKWFQPWINKPYGLMEETEESESERVVEQSIGGDDDIVEPEEVEDLIDEEDKEKEEENEDIEETMSLLEDKGHNEGEKDTYEKNYKETGASRVVRIRRVTLSLGSEFEIGGLRKIKEAVEENSEKIVTEKLQKKTTKGSKVIVNVHSH